MKYWLRLCLLLALCLLLTLSCHTHPPLDGGAIVRNHQALYWLPSDFPLLVLVDDQMTEDQVAAVYDATDMWNDSVGVTVFVSSIADFSHPAPRTTGFIAVSVRQLDQSSTGINFLGMQQSYFDSRNHMLSSKVWYDTDNIELDEYFHTMVHELGHSLTLAHDPDDIESVMYPTVAPTRGIIKRDDLDRILHMILGTSDLCVHYTP